MADYINRDDAIKKITEAQDKAMTGIEDVTYYRAIKIIREMSTADVQPVRRGRWIPQVDELWCSYEKKGRSL